MANSKMLKDDPAFAVHLSFNGNCREAFHYYHSCFGGDLKLQTLGDTPGGAGMNGEMRKIVVWASLKNEYFKLVGTDLTDEDPIVPGNSVSILVEFPSYTHRVQLINKLTGRNYCSIETTNPLVNLIDKYRIHWILTVHL